MPDNGSLYIGKFSDIAAEITPEVLERNFPEFGKTKWSQDDILAAIVNDGKPVAIARMTPNPYANSGKPEMFLHFVEVSAAERHKGLASTLLTGIFDYAANLQGGGDLLFDGFTADGKNYLMHKLNELSRKTGVDTIFVPGS